MPDRDRDRHRASTVAPLRVSTDWEAVHPVPDEPRPAHSGHDAI